MTVIAWDGKTLAADKMMGFGTSKVTVTKICRIDGMLFGWAGDAALGRACQHWVHSGMAIDAFPPAQRTNTGSMLIIMPDGEIRHYGSEPYPMIIEEKFYTVGSGDEYAAAALYLGKSAREAVEVACALDPNCGMGIDTLELA